MSTFKINQVIYCVCEPPFSMHLTIRNAYKVIAVGTGTKEGKVRIQSDKGRLVWLSELNFSASKKPEIISVTIDEIIDDPENDSIEVTLEFDNGSQRFLRFATPAFIKEMLSNGNDFYHDANCVYIPFLSEEKIKNTINDLDKSNDLINLTIPYV